MTINITSGPSNGSIQYNGVDKIVINNAGITTANLTVTNSAIANLTVTNSAIVPTYTSGNIQQIASAGYVQTYTRSSTGMQIYSVAGVYTFTMPASGQVHVVLHGAGMGGNSNGYSGASGGYIEGTYFGTPGSSITVTIGAGGLVNNFGGACSFGGILSVLANSGSTYVGSTPTYSATSGTLIVYALNTGNDGGLLYSNGANVLTTQNTGGIYNVSHGIFGGGGGSHPSPSNRGGAGYCMITW